MCDDFKFAAVQQTDKIESTWFLIFSNDRRLDFLVAHPALEMSSLEDHLPLRLDAIALSAT